MAYYISSPTTFCEVTYDSDWLNFDRDDRHLTPYRYSLLRNDTDTNSDTVSLTLPSFTYYEYLRSLYDCRSTPTRVPPPGYAGPPGSHIGQQGRSVTWHAFNKDNASELSRQAVKSEPTRIRPTYPFPSLHLIQGGDSGDELDDEYAYADRSKEKLVWVDALNKWVPQKQLHPRPYMSFVGNVPVLEKHGKLPREIAGGGWESEGAQTCERFEMHMGQRTSVSQPQDKSRLRNNEKREAIRKRAQELAEQKKQRKAYSTPLYTSLTERKQNLKPHIQSSRHHSSLPVSPVQRKEKIPSPKEVWQARDHSITEKRPSPSPVPMKREISIKLVSPTPEDEVKDEEDDKDKLSEKKVTFIDEGKKTTPKSSKKKKAKRKKGKAKTQSKPIKVEKAPKKPVKKVVEEKPQEQMQKVIPKPKPEPPSKPILAGIGAQQKPVKAMTQGVKPEMKVSEEKLPVSKPADIEPVTEEEIIKPKSPATERGKSNVEQKEIVKKEKRDGRKCVKKSEETTKPLPELEVDAKKVDPWIFDQEDFSEKKDLGKEELQVEIEPLPVLSGDLNPELIEKEKKERKENKRKSVLASLIGSEKTIKKWRKPGHLDSSYADELRRLELAEERRKRQMEMFERLKNRRVSNFSDAFDDGSPRFEDYGFLAKYCIFTKGNIEMYRHAFDAVDEGSSGWLEGEDVMIALRGVNNKLTEAEEEYLYRVLELTGYKLTHGADFKIFSVLAALSQRISALDKWMKNLIGKMDFKALEMKMFKCKTLWECNVDKDTNSISIDQLCVDLRAGGVSYEHETEVREKLAHLHAIDLLDFLTYIPLFIMIHESVVRNPLDDTRNK